MWFYCMPEILGEEVVQEYRNKKGNDCAYEIKKPKKTKCISL
jgi:hypothetical protein